MWVVGDRDPSTIIILISTKLPVVKKSGADSANSRKILLLTLYSQTPVDYLIFRFMYAGLWFHLSFSI